MHSGGPPFLLQNSRLSSLYNPVNDPFGIGRILERGLLISPPVEDRTSADEETSIQARSRKAQSLPTQSQRPMKIEHEYSGWGPGPISPPWTSTVQNSSAAAKPKVERCPLTVSCIK